MGLVASVLEAGILTGPVISSHFAVSKSIAASVSAMVNAQNPSSIFIS